jgi:hypothetical protein
LTLVSSKSVHCSDNICQVRNMSPDTYTHQVRRISTLGLVIEGNLETGKIVHDLHTFLMLFPYSFLISHSCSPTSFMVGRSSRVGAAHWNAKLRSFSSTSSSTWSSSNGSSLQLYGSASRKNLHKQYAKGEDITLWS